MRNAPDSELAFLYTAVSLIPLSYTTFFVILLLPLRTRLNTQLNMLCEQIVKDDSVNNDTIDDSTINAEIVKTDRISAENGGMQVIEQKHE